MSMKAIWSFQASSMKAPSRLQEGPKKVDECYMEAQRRFMNAIWKLQAGSMKAPSRLQEGSKKVDECYMEA